MSISTPVTQTARGSTWDILIFLTSSLSASTFDYFMLWYLELIWKAGLF